MAMTTSIRPMTTVTVILSSQKMKPQKVVIISERFMKRAVSVAGPFLRALIRPRLATTNEIPKRAEYPSASDEKEGEVANRMHQLTNTLSIKKKL